MKVLLTNNGVLETQWPFTRKRFEQRLQQVAELVYVDVRRARLVDVDWETYDAVALFGGEMTERMLDRAIQLKVVGGITDVKGPSCFDSLVKRRIPFIDGTPAWGQSVAEIGIALMLCALRKVPHWHGRLAAGSFDWAFPYGQFCDDETFVNGTLGTKTVGVIGLGQIGSRIAKWCTMFGATVLGYDPFAPDERFREVGATEQDIETLIGEVEVLVVAVPPTPSAQNLVDARQVMRLRKGSVVTTITRTAAIDCQALRKRVLANELFWASDVYDIEPLAADDPILGRDNVVHIPHIAGRTKDANLRLADIITEGFMSVFNGSRPQSVLTPQAVQVRTESHP